MKIIETNLKFTKTLETRPRTEQIVIHHTESGDVPAATVHEWHLARSFAGIGYHYLIHGDGSIERGRPEWAVGAHAKPANYNGIGVCFAGNFMGGKEPTQAALAAAGELIRDIRSRYGDIPVKKHRDVDDTDCPGDSFPWAKLRAAIETEGGEAIVNDWAVKEIKTLKDKGIISGAHTSNEPVTFGVLAALVVNLLKYLGK